jgi:1-acyl-sn-glycerol-3-phosphate acyltransferase
MLKLFVRILSKIWVALFILNFIITLLLLFPFFYILLQRKPWFRLAMKLKRVWAHFIIFDLGIFYSIKREAKLDKKQAYVFCPNHTSYLDVVLSYIAITNYFHYMGKYELGKAPLFGIFFKEMDIAVNRSSVRDAHKAFLRAGVDIEEGTSIALFPEGTISPHVPELLKFKNGPFKLAIEKQVPIVPITFKNNWLILPDSKKSKNSGGPGIAKVIVHKPISTKGLTEDDVDSLKQQVYDVINSELKKK